MTSLFSYLHKSLKVTPLEENQVEVTVTLQSDEYVHYLRLLDSLTGFIRTINSKTKLAKHKNSDYSKFEQDQARATKDKYYKRIVQGFDLYTSQGLDRKAAIKQIGADLRKENHPWSSPDLVRFSLRDAGRPGRVGRPRRQP